MLAPIRLEDSDKTAAQKMALVSGYLDIFAARRIVNFRTLVYSSILCTMFKLIKEIRDMDVVLLAALLGKKTVDIPENFGGIDTFSLHQQNRRSVHYLLARMTYHVEQETGLPTSFETYTSRSIKKPLKSSTFGQTSIEGISRGERPQRAGGPRQRAEHLSPICRLRSLAYSSSGSGMTWCTSAGKPAVVDHNGAERWPRPEDSRSSLATDDRVGARLLGVGETSGREISSTISSMTARRQSG